MRIWTLEVRGGTPFRIDVDNHPSLEHDGAVSLWHTNLEPPQIAAIKEVAENRGATVSVYSDGGEESKRQENELAEKLQKEGWKTERCPLCYFCDLTIPSRCGKLGWGATVLKTAMKHPEAKESVALCPLGKSNG